MSLVSLRALNNCLSSTKLGKAHYVVEARHVGGRGCRGAACGVSRGETAPSADLGGSSKYSNENFED